MERWNVGMLPIAKEVQSHGVEGKVHADRYNLERAMKVHLTQELGASFSLTGIRSLQYVQNGKK